MKKMESDSCDHLFYGVSDNVGGQPNDEDARSCSYIYKRPLGEEPTPVVEEMCQNRSCGRIIHGKKKVIDVSIFSVGRLQFDSRIYSFFSDFFDKQAKSYACFTEGTSSYVYFGGTN